MNIRNQSKIGCVVIGRNEGERLVRCLNSIFSTKEKSEAETPVVYVDSGSEDGSVTYCIDEQIDLIALDISMPFSAGRARNAGFHRLLETENPGYVFFVDGDCEVVQSWLPTAIKFLDDNTDFAIVCGRRRERKPEESIYNKLCDIEWNTEIGDAKSCGGDFMVRADVFKQIGGFNENIVAGEEPELCLRIRTAGWKIRRMDEEMTLHDAMITTFSQWWRRTLRSGHAFAQNCWLHSSSVERMNTRMILSISMWGVVVPLLLFTSIFTNYWHALFALLMIWIVMVVKISRSVASKRNLGIFDSILYGFFTMLGKIPQSIGAFVFFIRNLRSTPFKIIEYK